MNKSTKIIIAIVAVALIAYGVYAYVKKKNAGDAKLVALPESKPAAVAA